MLELPGMFCKQLVSNSVRFSEFSNKCYDKIGVLFQITSFQLITLN